MVRTQIPWALMMSSGTDLASDLHDRDDLGRSPSPLQVATKTTTSGTHGERNKRLSLDGTSTLS